MVVWTREVTHLRHCRCPGKMIKQFGWVHAHPAHSVQSNARLDVR